MDVAILIACLIDHTVCIVEHRMVVISQCLVPNGVGLQSSIEQIGQFSTDCIVLCDGRALPMSGIAVRCSGISTEHGGSFIVNSYNGGS